MQFRILGPLEVVADRGVVEIAPPRQRSVLAILLIEANRVVSLDRLVDRLYRGDPPPHAIGSVQAYVSHLRRLLEPDRRHRGPSRVLVSQAPGYLLVVDPTQYDGACFEAGVGAGRTALRDGRPDGALACLDAALALWRGPALADFAYEPFADAEAARLNELHTVALESRIHCLLALGQHQALVPDIEKLLADHPLREDLWAALVLALYRAGRQSDALRAYQRCRTVLGDEVGLQPGVALRRLEADVLAQAATLDWRPPSGGSALDAAEPVGPDPGGVGRRRTHLGGPGAGDGRSTVGSAPCDYGPRRGGSGRWRSRHRKDRPCHPGLSAR